MTLRVAMLVLALAACGHPGERSEGPRTLATLESAFGTPAWVGVNNGQLLVAGIHGEIKEEALTLVAIDLASGSQQQIAGSLPFGELALYDHKLYLAGALGEVGTVALPGGGYTKVADLPSNASALAVSAAGYLVGAKGGIDLVTFAGARSRIPGPSTDPLYTINQIIDTARGLVACSTLAGMLLRVSPSGATVLLDKQPMPQALAATQTQLLWTTGDGASVGQHLMAMPLEGGQPVKLVDVTSPSLIDFVAASGTLIAYSTESPTDPAIYVIASGGAPRKVTTAKGSLLSMSGNNLYWVESAGAGYTVKTIRAD